MVPGSTQARARGLSPRKGTIEGTIEGAIEGAIGNELATICKGCIAPNMFEFFVAFPPRGITFIYRAGPCHPEIDREERY